ncbi:MAG: response regulator [Leptospiraceae bacterium]|nr:response regulator [Leptospiraceae bacterium]
MITSILDKVRFEYKIAFTYMIMGFVWIIFSDSILEYFKLENVSLTKLQTFKGSFFVSITSLLLFYLIRKQILKLKKNEHEIRQKNIFIQTVLDKLPIGIALNTIHGGNATYMNKKFIEIYGWSFEDISSISNFFQRVYPDKEYRNKVTNKILKDIGSGIAENMHWENMIITQKDGKNRIVNAVNIPLVEQNTMVSTVWDVTDFHNIQKDLIIAKEKSEESNRLKSAFLQNMSHEVRTPLNAIVGFSELLTKTKLSSEKKQAFSEMIYSSSEKLIEIITDVIEISQIHSTQINIVSNQIEIITFIKNIINKFSIKAKNKYIDLFFNINTPFKEYNVVTDKEKLKKIITHVLDNAIKFTHHGLIEINCKVTIGNFQVSVTDTGIGIPADMQEEIFEPFRQVETNTTCRHYGGNGLGLSLVKAYTQLLNGSISLTSEMGKGSKFTISIPVKGEIPSISISEKKYSINTVLIVEDEYVNYQYLLAVLENYNIKILYAEDGQKAVDICKENNEIDLILMDIKMPILDGYSAAKIIKKLRPSLPIVAQSAYALEQERENYSKDIFDDYITKPIQESELENKVLKYIDCK